MSKMINVTHVHPTLVNLIQGLIAADVPNAPDEIKILSIYGDTRTLRVMTIERDTTTSVVFSVINEETPIVAPEDEIGTDESN